VGHGAGKPHDPGNVDPMNREPPVAAECGYTYRQPLRGPRDEINWLAGGLHIVVPPE